MLLRPDVETNGIFVFALAVASKRFEIDVHGFCVMSTHIHLVITDTTGTLPAFLQWLHRTIALAMKVHRRWEGTLWDAAKTSVVRLETRAALVEKLAYTLANPVTAGLVSSARDWPGARSTVEEIGSGTRKATIPTSWFDSARGTWPEEVVLRIAAPLETEGTLEQLKDEISEALVNKEREAREVMIRERRQVAGVRRVLRTSPFARITTPEPIRSTNPTFATGHAGREAALEAIARVRAFRLAHREAFERWRSGSRETAFPAGTWWMKVIHGVRVDLAGGLA